MSEEEVLIRAREASIAAGYCDLSGYGDEKSAAERAAVRAGQRDNNWSILVAARALRDIDRPLSEIQPPDPDINEAAELLLKLNANGVGPYQCTTGILAAIKRGRELERAGR